jgi:hypothetical protein
MFFSANNWDINYERTQNAASSTFDNSTYFIYTELEIAGHNTSYFYLENTVFEFLSRECKEYLAFSFSGNKFASFSDETKINLLLVFSFFTYCTEYYYTKGRYFICKHFDRKNMKSSQCLFVSME